MKIVKGDKVVVIAGKDKGKEGIVQAVYPKKNKVVVEGVDASNVAIVDPKTKKASRVGYAVDKDGKKIRISKASGSKLN